LLQTFQPEHPVIHAILGGDENAFWAAEAAGRRAAGTPPYGRLAGVILSSTDIGALLDFASDIARRDGPLRGIGAQLYGPAPAPVARVRGRHRVRLLIKSDKTVALQPAILAWLAQFKIPNHVRLSVDIDPQSFY
jgi:primosomal protein N' (replication factor Y)